MAQLTLEELQAHLLAFMEVELAKMKQSILEIPAAEMSVVLEQFEKTQLEEYMGNDVIRHDTLRAFIKTLSRFSGWADGQSGAVLTSEQDMDAAIPGKYYAFTLSEQHSEMPASNGSLFVMNSDEADGVIQVATVVISGAVKQYARSGEVNAYSPFAEISGGGNVYIKSTPPNSPEEGDTWISTITLTEYKYLTGNWLAFVPVTEITGNIDCSIDDGIIINCRINDEIIINCKS